LPARKLKKKKKKEEEKKKKKVEKQDQKRCWVHSTRGEGVDHLLCCHRSHPLVLDDSGGSEIVAGDRALVVVDVVALVRRRLDLPVAKETVDAAAVVAFGSAAGDGDAIAAAGAVALVVMVMVVMVVVVDFVVVVVVGAAAAASASAAAAGSGGGDSSCYC